MSLISNKNLTLKNFFNIIPLIIVKIDNEEIITYFGFFNKILLSLSLGEIPRAMSEFSEQIKMPEPKERDSTKFTFETENKFEDFYIKMSSFFY